MTQSESPRDVVQVLEHRLEALLNGAEPGVPTNPAQPR